MPKMVKDISVLRQKSIDVASVEEATSIIKSLKEVLETTDNGVGLAAVQIGIPKKVGVIKVSDGEYVELINPELVNKEFEFIFLHEGCLSFPNEYRDTIRYRQVTIKNKVIDGDKFGEETQVYYRPEPGEKYSGNPLTCIAIQHELDHFEGKLIKDYSIKIDPIVNMTHKVGRNEPCPCGKTDSNGKRIKYKKCCGK